MHMVKTFGVFFASALVLLTSALQAQSPAPIIVPAASPAVPVVSAVPNDSAQTQARIKALEEIRATNQEILKKQKAALDQLDEIQKSADQLKAYSKRG